MDNVLQYASNMIYIVTLTVKREADEGMLRISL